MLKAGSIYERGYRKFVFDCRHGWASFRLVHVVHSLAAKSGIQYLFISHVRSRNRICNNCQSICKFYGRQFWLTLSLTGWLTFEFLINWIQFTELTFRILAFFLWMSVIKKQRLLHRVAFFLFPSNALVISRFFEHNECMFSASHVYSCNLRHWNKWTSCIRSLYH